MEHVNLTVGERWEDNMTKFWYEVRELGQDDVVGLEQIRKGKVIPDNDDNVDIVDQGGRSCAGARGAPAKKFGLRRKF